MKVLDGKQLETSGIFQTGDYSPNKFYLQETKYTSCLTALIQLAFPSIHGCREESFPLGSRDYYQRWPGLYPACQFNASATSG